MDIKYKLSIFSILLLSSFIIFAGLASSEILCPVPSTPDNLSCIVTKITDGDTMHAQCNGIDTRIRLTIIDSYESTKNPRAFKQAYEQKLTVEDVVQRGKKAKEITSHELLNKSIIVVPPAKHKIDRYGRVLGKVYVDCEDINMKLLNEHPDVFLKY